MYRFVMKFKSKVASWFTREALLALTPDERNQRQRGADESLSGANEELHEEMPDRAYMAWSAGRNQGEDGNEFATCGMG